MTVPAAPPETATSPALGRLRGTRSDFMAVSPRRGKRKAARAPNVVAPRSSSRPSIPCGLPSMWGRGPSHHLRTGVRAHVPGGVESPGRKVHDENAPMRRVTLALAATTSFALAACTSSLPATENGGIPTPSPNATSSTSTMSRSSPDAIELPSLPRTGLAAMWSRSGHAIGVSLLTLRGRVVATMPKVFVWDPTSPSGIVMLRSKNLQRYWLLDTSAHELVPITEQRGAKLHWKPSHGRLPIPPRSVGSWSWAMSAPSGTTVLGEYYQHGYGSQYSECATPVAMRESAPGLEPTPILGESLATVHTSFALGWTPTSKAVVAVTLATSTGPSPIRQGVYIFGGEGAAPQRVALPRGTYYVQMWGPP
jgi:hypothetical protein